MAAPIASSSPAISIARVHALAAGRLQERRPLRAVGDELRHGTQGPGRGDAMGQAVRGDDRGGAGRQGELDQQQADRSGPEDPDAVAGSQPRQAQGVDGDAQRLQHRAPDVVDGVREGDQLGLRPGEELAHGAVAGPVAQEPDVRAQVPEAARAGGAPLARDGGIDGDPLPRPRSRGDHPGRLVTQDQRLAEAHPTDGALAEPVEVRAADPDGGDADERLARPRQRHRLVGEPGVTGAVEADDLHRAFGFAAPAASAVASSSSSAARVQRPPRSRAATAGRRSASSERRTRPSSGSEG